jgi:hypothetical protein
LNGVVVGRLNDVAGTKAVVERCVELEEVRGSEVRWERRKLSEEEAYEAAARAALLVNPLTACSATPRTARACES